MPRQKPPATLRSVCLASVAQRFCSLRHINNEHWEKMKEYYRLPADAAKELIGILKDINRLQCTHLILIMHPGISSLDLSWFNFDLEYFLQRSAVDLQNLHHLDLSFSLEITQTAFLELARSIPKIKVLHLQSTGCTDSVLNLIGTCCPQLQDMDLAWCPITDLGLMGFCVDLVSPSTSNSVRCPQLHRLCITGTMATVAGAAFVLEKLPHLCDLDFVDTFEVLEALHSGDLETRKIDKVPKYNLRVLRSTGTNKSWLQRILTPECFKITTTTCPLMSHVIMANANTPVEGLLLLSRCRHLTKLELGFGSSNMLGFSDILPLLQVIGHQLTSLALSELIAVDVGAIGTNCPKLHQLSLCNIDGYTSISSIDKNTCFSFLQSFTLLDVLENPIPSCVLLNLLSSCCLLTQLRLIWCPNFSSSFLCQLLHNNALEQLQTLDLEACDFFIYSSLMLLLKADNPLSYIGLRHCRAITRMDYCLLLTYIKSHNLQVTIEWVE